MISKEELREYSHLRKLNLGQAEKEYFQNIILFIFSGKFGREVVFKGGTALQRAYGLNRFSEDLDFTLDQEKPFKEILQKGLAAFFLEAEIQEEKSPRSLKYSVRIKGPLYIGLRQSLCKIQLDFSLREKVLLEPALATIGRLLKELPPFDVVVMSKEEILAEKVRAIMARTKARDVYDLWFLLTENTAIDMKLIQEKLKYYNLDFSLKEFQQHLHLKKEIWETELKPLIEKVPPFLPVIRVIQARFSEAVT